MRYRAIVCLYISLPMIQLVGMDQKPPKSILRKASGSNKEKKITFDNQLVTGTFERYKGARDSDPVIVCPSSVNNVLVKAMLDRYEANKNAGIDTDGLCELIESVFANLIGVTMMDSSWINQIVDCLIGWEVLPVEPIDESTWEPQSYNQWASTDNIYYYLLGYYSNLPVCEERKKVEKLIAFMLEHYQEFGLSLQDLQSLLHFTDRRDKQQSLVCMAIIKSWHNVANVLIPYAPLDEFGKEGITPLCLAALAKNLQLVRLLLKAGASADSCDGYCRTPLHFVVMSGQVDLLGEFIGKADLEACYGVDKSTPLYNAAAAGHASMVRALLDAGASLTAVDKDENTPLHCAAMNHHAEAVRVLLQRGAVMNQPNKLGWKPEATIVELLGEEEASKYRNAHPRDSTLIVGAIIASLLADLPIGRS